MLDEGFGIGNDSAGSHSNVTVHLEDLFDAAGDYQGRVESPLDSQDDSLFDFDADCRRTELGIAIDHTLIASMAYSTWKMRPSGENVLMPLS